MPTAKPHPNELRPPLMKVGKDPRLPLEIARLWIADDDHGGDFVSVVYTPSKNAEMYAWIIGRLAIDIAAGFAKKNNLDQLATEERLIEHLRLNLLERNK